MRVLQPRLDSMLLFSASWQHRPAVASSSVRAQHRHRHLTTAQAAKMDRESSKASNSASYGNGARPRDAECEEDLYPVEEEDGGGFFPVRDPGEFPSVGVRGRMQRLASRAAAKLSGMTGVQLPSTAPLPAPVAAEAAEFDPLRDGPLRYLGYANECGEAFAAWLPWFGVPLSYAIAIGYVLVDTADKGYRAHQAAALELGGRESLHPDVNMGRLVKLLSFERAMDTIVWQLLASVICPGYTIHTVVALVHAGLVPLEAQQAVQDACAAIAPALSLEPQALLQLVDKSVPTAAGLGAIPFIVHPIDNAIHALLNASMRPAMRKYICSVGQGSLADLAICDEECRVPEEPSSEQQTS